MKFIIINGPCGVGKSTLGQGIHESIPLSVFVDIDEVRRSISDYREYRTESGFLAFELALGIAERAMENGSTVIIDKIRFDYPQAPKDYLQEFITLANKYDAQTFEFILRADKEIVLDRITMRGLDKNSLLTMDRAEQFCDEIEKFIPQRTSAVIIDTTYTTSEEVFKSAWKIINQ